MTKNVQNTKNTAIGYKPVLATGLISRKRTPWNLGKRKPIEDDCGIKWCACLNPNLTSNAGGRGQAFCLLCGYPWFH